MYKHLFLIVSLFFIGCSSSQPQKPKVQKVQKIIMPRIVTQHIPTQKYEVVKSACMINNNYSILEVKNKLLDKAKKLAVEEIFGTVINSNLELLNGKITKDKIIKKTMGFVRLKGDPKYYNGKNFAEVCVKIDAYVTKKDLDIYKLKTVSLVHNCFNNPEIAIKNIKPKAMEQAYIKLVQIKKPSLKISAEDAKKLLYDIKINNESLDINSGVYCFDISAKISLIDVESYMENHNIKDTDLFDEDNEEQYQTIDNIDNLDKKDDLFDF